jgi:hypothetical protein
MKRLLPGLAACLIPIFCGAQEKPPEDWAKELGSEDPAIRQQAERELADRDATLARLAEHPDPWVAARATRLLMERRGIDTRIPRRLQLAVLGFGKLDEARRNEVLEELARSGPGHLNALAFIHGQETQGKKLTEAESGIWRQRFQYCINTNLADAGTLRLEPLSPATRAFLLSCFPDRSPEESAERYAKWRALDSAIRIHLPGRHVVLEIDHLKEHADTAGLLEYLPLILDPAAGLEAARLVSEAVTGDKAFKAEALGESAAIGHMLVLMREGGIRKAQPWYAKHLATHPGIAAKLPPALTPLEVDRLLKAGALSPAIGLVVKFFPDVDSRARLDWNTLREISDKLGTKPESLPEGLPAIGDERSLPAMGGLLQNWFPMTRPDRGYPDIDAKVECFDRWARTDEWLEAARRHGPHPLYHLVMARRGKIGEALLSHEFERESEALKNLGALILLRPAIATEIPARQCSEATLREVLDGGFSILNSNSPLPAPLLDLATEWSGFYPDLLAADAFPTRPLYLAALAWRKGETEKAAAALLACAKPIPIDPAPGQSPQRPMTRPNPLASAAISLLASLLAEKSDADLKLLLPPEEAGREILQAMLDRLIRMENRTPGQVRAAMAISQLLRDRFAVKDAKPLFSAHEARSFALDSWMAGDAKLAGDFQMQAYLSEPDPEEHYDSIFAPALRLLGRAEETLAQLEGDGNPLPASVKTSKRARLLRELGRTKEAMDCASPDHHPALRLRLAIETETWDPAIRATLDLEDETKKREAMQACIALLCGKKELVNRHTAGKHPVLNLLKGNGIREKDIAEMARDTELLSRLESRLTAALASGEPILAIDMSAYFQHLDLLPDRNRAILLAAELAKRDTCVFASASSGEKLTGHKVLAAETLLLLGRGELAFAAMRPLMEASVEPHDFKRVEGGAVTGGRIPAVVAGYRQATRLAHFEWPEETAAQRMDRLGVILENKEPLARARGLIALISKHEAKLETLDLLQALQLAFLDLAHAGEVPEEVKESARALLLKRQPDPQETRWLESQWARVPWTDETRHRPSKGKPTTKVSFEPKPGADSDPKKPGFVIIDGLAAATKLHKQGDAAAARTLLQDVTIRLLLDSDLMRQEAEWNVEIQGPDGHFGSRFDSRGFLSVLGYFDLLEAPGDLVSGLIDACAYPWTNYSDARRLHHAARVMAAAGDLPAALAYHRRFLVATMPAFGSEDVGVSGRREIAEMHRIRGMIAASEGDSATAVNTILQLVQIAPYVPNHARDITAILTKNGDTEAMKSARAAVEGFWRIRLLEIPESKTYRHWQKEWASLFP